METSTNSRHDNAFASFFARIFRPCLGLFVSAVTPPACRHCGDALAGYRNPFLCPQCLGELKWIGAGACRGCGYPAGPHAELGKSCRHCHGRNTSLTGVLAAVRYAKGARSLVTALKFHGETELAAPMAEIMALRAQEFPLSRLDLVLPIPLHPSRERARGFNQAELLAARIASRLSIRLETAAVKKTRHTTPQSALTRLERIENAKGNFRTDADLTGKSILLVDDVVTTGATLAECAHALRGAGAKHVYALAFAR
jgi:Predicted amidophosphoribosyltransferases